MRQLLRAAVMVSAVAWLAQKTLVVHEQYNAASERHAKALAFKQEFCDNDAIMSVLRRHTHNSHNSHHHQGGGGGGDDVSFGSDDTIGSNSNHNNHNGMLGHAQSTIDECDAAAQLLMINPLERTVLQAIHDVGLCGHHRCDAAWAVLERHSTTLGYAAMAGGAALLWMGYQLLRHRAVARAVPPLHPEYPVVVPWYAAPREHAFVSLVASSSSSSAVAAATQREQPFQQQQQYGKAQQHHQPHRQQQQQRLIVSGECYFDDDGDGDCYNL